MVISTNIEYRKQLKIFDEPIGCMELREIRHNVLTFIANIKFAGKISAEAIQRCVVIDVNTSKMIPLHLSDGVIKPR